MHLLAPPSLLSGTLVDGAAASTTTSGTRDELDNTSYTWMVRPHALALCAGGAVHEALLDDLGHVGVAEERALEPRLASDGAAARHLSDSVADEATLLHAIGTQAAGSQPRDWVAIGR